MFQFTTIPGEEKISTGGGNREGNRDRGTIFMPRISLIPPTRSTFPVKVTWSGEKRLENAEKMEVWTS